MKTYIVSLVGPNSNRCCVTSYFVVPVGTLVYFNSSEYVVESCSSSLTVVKVD